MKLISSQLKWLAGLIILVIAIPLIGSCVLANQPPAISSLTSNEEQIAPAGISRVECIASDPDGDELNYIWSASGGNISGEGPVVTWTAPDAPGTYTLTVEITDGKSGEATAQLTIDVIAINHPPAIESLATEWQQVRKAASSTAECVASDPDGDELSYTWSASGGNISGKGHAVTWVAPNAYGTYTITVTVSDGRGSKASKSTSIQVCSCPGAGGN